MASPGEEYTPVDLYAILAPADRALAPAVKRNKLARRTYEDLIDARAPRGTMQPAATEHIRSTVELDAVTRVAQLQVTETVSIAVAVEGSVSAVQAIGSPDARLIAVNGLMDRLDEIARVDEDFLARREAHSAPEVDQQVKLFN